MVVGLKDTIPGNVRGGWPPRWLSLSVFFRRPAVLLLAERREEAMTVRKLMLAWLPLAGALLMGACSAERQSRPQLLIITLDTARADRFSFSGDSPVETPVVDSLAAEGTVFLQAISPAPITLVTHASLFTGQLPTVHGVRNNGTYRLPNEAVTLAELLQERGYRTGAFVGAAVLDAKYGLSQGFDHYDDTMAGATRVGIYAERRGEAVVEAALDWIGRQGDAPTFAWVHLFDPHIPYNPPEPERSLHAGSPYNGEIAYSDRVIGRLLEGYRRLGLYDDTIVVFASDHGESLGDHGELTHGIFLYDSTMHVPLILRIPGQAGGKRVDSQVQLVDVFPTLAAVLDLDIPDGVQGRDLGFAMRGEALDPAPAYLETILPLEDHGWFELRGLRTGGWKLIVGPKREMYDLRSDPAENRDLVNTRPDRVSELEGILRNAFPERGSEPSQRIEMDQSTREQLRALGYLSVDEPSPGGTGRGLQQSHLERRMTTARELFNGGFRRQGIERCRSLLGEDLASEQVEKLCVSMLVAAGRYGEAEQVCGVTPEADAASAWAQSIRGLVLERLGRLDDAIDAYGKAMRIDAADMESRRRRWELLMRLGRGDEVDLEASAAIEDGVSSGAVQALLLTVQGQSRDPSEQAKAVKAALASAPDNPELLFALGVSLARQDRQDLALASFQRAHELKPEDPQYLLRLAQTLLELGRAAEVHRLLADLDALHVLTAELWVTFADACLRTGDLPCAAKSAIRVSALVPHDLERWLGSSRRLHGFSTAERQGLRGELLHLAGRPAKAAQAFQKASELEPDNPKWAYKAGRALEAEGRAQRAVTWHARAERAGHRPARTDRWRLMLDMGREEDVAREARRALIANPFDGEARVQIALAATRGGGVAARVNALEAQLKQEPDATAVMAALAEALGATQRAATFYRRVLEKAPDHIGASLGLARLLLESGRVNEARSILQGPYRKGSPEPEVLLAYAEACALEGDRTALREALTLATDLLLREQRERGPTPTQLDEIEPQVLKSASALNSIGNACWDKGNYTEAVHAFTLGAHLVPNDPRFHYNLGLAWERVSDMEEALKAFDSTLALDPDYSKARRHREYTAAVLDHLGSGVAARK